MRHFLAVLFVIGLISLFSSPVWAVTEEECLAKSGQDKIDCLTSLVTQTQQQESSLTNDITKFNASIDLTTARIQQTEAQIEKLGLEIKNLSGKIDQLQNSLGHLSNVLLERIIATYKQGSIEPLTFLLSSNGFSNLLTRAEYIKIMQAHDKKIMYQMQDTKDTYTDQKTLREQKKLEQQTLQNQLQSQKIQLAREVQAKQNLLAETQNDESVYQNLLEKAKQELSGFSAFTESAGGGIASFGNGSNGWYYTQRDPAWGNMLLPGSSSSLLLAGCAVTSVAMVCKSYGQGVTPASIASDSNNFFYGDLWNWAFSCSGKTTNWIGASQEDIKSYVKNNTPVILRLIAPSVSGLHFIVAFGWDDGKNDFKIHDPYYGPDKYFGDRYSWSQVTTAVVIH